jgi:hypothetical protein
MNSPRKGIVGFILSTSLAIALSVWSSGAGAVPGFARQLDKACSYCHNAWPQLNQKGREFRELGFKFTTDEKIAADIPPFSAMFVARPYDRRQNSSTSYSVRAFHELEVFIAGAVTENFSVFAEIEAEDETNFEPEVTPARANYHYNRAFNMQFAWGPVLGMDSYGFLGDNFRLTRASMPIITRTFGGADAGGALRDDRQVVSVFGRPFGPLFYDVGYSGVAGDTEGREAQTAHARVAFDVTENFMIGVFGVDGEDQETVVTASTGRTFKRTGVDLQLDIGDLRIQAAAVNAEDDNATLTAEVENKAASVQAFYAFRKDKQPTWVPLVRYDMYETNGGSQEFGEVVFNLTRYFTENVKGYVEYWKQIDVPDGTAKDDRVTLQLFIGI